MIQLELATGRRRRGFGPAVRAFDTTIIIPPQQGISANAPAGVLTNADFNGPAGWSSTGGFAVVNGELVIANGGGQFFYQSGVSQVGGKQYRLTMYIRELSAGGIRCVFNYGAIDISFTRAGLFTVVYEANTNGDTFNLQSFGGLTAKIPYVQISAV